MSELTIVDPPRGNSGLTAARLVGQARQFLAQPAVRRALPLAGLAGLGAAAVFAWGVIGAGEDRDLVPGMADQDKAAVAQALDAARLGYHIDRSTGALRVSGDDYYKARMLLAAQGLPKAAAGLPDAEPMPLGASEAVERQHLQSARESELARAIESIEVVERATVRLAEEAPSLFVRERKPPTASVMVTMHAGRTLSASQVIAISNLVSASVPGLSAEDVAIVDQAGRLLSQQSGDGGALGAQLGFQVKVEDRYRQALSAVLTPLVGPDGFTAQVHADIDWTSTDATRETFPEAGKALRSEDQKWTSDEALPPAVGVPGALSNTPPPATVVTTSPVPVSSAIAPPAAGVRSQDVSRRFELGREVSVTRGATGAIRRLSLAVALRAVPGKPRSPAEMAAIEALIRGAVGADAARGDVIAVSARPFVEPVVAPVPLFQSPWVGVGLRYGAMLVGLIAAWMVLGRHLLKRYQATTKAMRDSEIASLLRSEANGPAGGTDGITLEMIEAAPGYADRAALVREYVRQDPARAARILKAMIHGGGR